MRFSISQVLLCLVIGCAVVPQSAMHQQKYFPEGLSEVYLGMTYEFMNKTREATQLEPVEWSADSTLLAYQEVHSDKAFDRVIYFFDAEGDQLLFEMAVEYPDGINPEEVAAKLYGGPNADEGEWYFEDEEYGDRLSMWINGQQLVISNRSIRTSE
ncbi:MAG: hypothetical protein AAGA85_16675 [Bacteroidota bacterium]